MFPEGKINKKKKTRTIFDKATLSFGTIRVMSKVALIAGSSQQGKARRASVAWRECERRRERWRQRDRKRGLRVSVGCSDLNVCKDICMASKTTGAQKHSIVTFSFFLKAQSGQQCGFVVAQPTFSHFNVFFIFVYF